MLARSDVEASFTVKVNALTEAVAAATTATADAMQRRNELQQQNESLLRELNTLRTELGDSQSARAKAEQAAIALQRELTDTVEQARRAADAERAELVAALIQAQSTITTLKQQPSAPLPATTSSSSSSVNQQSRSNIEQELDAANAVLSAQLTEARTALITAKAMASAASVEQAELTRTLQLRSQDADALRAANLSLDHELSNLRLKLSSESNVGTYKTMYQSSTRERDLLR